MISKKAIQALLLVTSVYLILSGIWIPIKAEIAQQLLKQAWSETRETGRPVKPWPWADHHPVAELTMAKYDIDQIVLAGDEGHVLAFAPGENMGAKAIGGGIRIISAHRDTHFKFLENVQQGDIVVLQGISETARYQVHELLVLDAKQFEIAPNLGGDQLLLVTCYPFDSMVSGGSQRYVVVANKIEETSYEM